MLLEAKVFLEIKTNFKETYFFLNNMTDHRVRKVPKTVTHYLNGP